MSVRMGTAGTKLSFILFSLDKKSVWNVLKNSYLAIMNRHSKQPIQLMNEVVVVVVVVIVAVWKIL